MHVQLTFYLLITWLNQDVDRLSESEPEDLVTFQAEEVHVAVILWEAVERRGAVLSRHIPDHSPLKHGKVQVS